MNTDKEILIRVLDLDKMVEWLDEKLVHLDGILDKGNIDESHRQYLWGQKSMVQDFRKYGIGWGLDPPWKKIKIGLSDIVEH